MLEKFVDNNDYILYKGRPLVRQKDELCYGDMSEKYFIYMLIMSEEENEEKIKVPAQIMVQLYERESRFPQEQKIVVGFKEAFEYADAWLNRFNN